MNDYFEEMNIDYSELNDYEDIETYYDKIKDYSNLVNELQCDRVESQKYIVRANKKLNQLQSNWNSLREWLNEYLKSNDKWYKSELSTHDKMYYCDIYTNTEFMLKKFLDKMNELEGKDKE